VLADWTAEFGSLWTGAAIDCLCAVGDGMISVELSTHVLLIRTYKIYDRH